MFCMYSIMHDSYVYSSALAVAQVGDGGFGGRWACPIDVQIIWRFEPGGGI